MLRGTKRISWVLRCLMWSILTSLVWFYDVNVSGPGCQFGSMLLMFSMGVLIGPRGLAFWWGLPTLPLFIQESATLLMDKKLV